MLPDTGAILSNDFKIRSLPSKTYQLNDNHVSGDTDGLEAVRQTIYCILNTERFEWLIYSWNYGIELKNLYGKSKGIVKSKLKKRIKEALARDDRIESVDAFSFQEAGNKVSVSFQVHTKFGVVEARKEVDI